MPSQGGTSSLSALQTFEEGECEHTGMDRGRRSTRVMHKIRAKSAAIDSNESQEVNLLTNATAGEGMMPIVSIPRLRQRGE